MVFKCNRIWRTSLHNWCGFEHSSVLTAYLHADVALSIAIFGESICHWRGLWCSDIWREYLNRDVAYNVDVWREYLQNMDLWCNNIWKVWNGTSAIFMYSQRGNIWLPLTNINILVPIQQAAFCNRLSLGYIDSQENWK